MTRRCWIHIGRLSAVVLMIASGAAIIYSFAAAKHEDIVEQTDGSEHVFVHLFEWSWEDVAQECEQFLGPKGFKAVQISPPQEHTRGPWWFTRYQPVTYKLTSRSGDEAAFISMVRRCNASGVAIYADAVINHCASPPSHGGTAVGTGGSKFGDRSFPMYTPDKFHHLGRDLKTNCKIHNYEDKHEVQFCDLNTLPDLCTGCKDVQDTIAAYLNRLAGLGVAGFRIDAAKHIDEQELGNILSRVDARLYKFLEVIGDESDAIKPSMYWQMGQVTAFGYGIFVGNAFKDKGGLQRLDEFGKANHDSSGFLEPSEHAVAFIDNHDTQRGTAGTAALTYKDGRLYDLAVVFMLAHPYGYPQLISSYAFDSSGQGPPPEPVHGRDGRLNCERPGQPGPWICEHRRPHIANMVAWRRTAGKDAITQFLVDGEGNNLAFCRGKSACVALNRGDTDWHTDLSVSVPAGHYCNIALSAEKGCPVLRVTDEGKVWVEIPPLGIVAFHIGALAPEPPPGERRDPDSATPLRTAGSLQGLWQEAVREFVYVTDQVARWFVYVTDQVARWADASYGTSFVV